MKWYYWILIVAIAIFMACGLGYSLAKIDSDKENFYECANMYEEGDCLLYQCQMNYSLSIPVSNQMYQLYHFCIINNDVKVAEGETEDKK